MGWGAGRVDKVLINSQRKMVLHCAASFLMFIYYINNCYCQRVISVCFYKFLCQCNFNS